MSTTATGGGVIGNILGIASAAGAALDKLNGEVLGKIFADAQANGKINPKHLIAFQQLDGMNRSVISLVKQVNDNERNTMNTLTR